MHHRPSKKEGFTLIELLVVIAIIAILTVVVILTLNPAELLKQARDSNRISDLATLTSALSIYSTDQSSAPSFSLGSPTTVDISVPDPSATSTAGDQCQSLGLFSLPSGNTYQCAAAANSRTTNGTGWIPINFSAISSGAPIGSLPVDPTNQTSSGFYYTYTTTGSQFQIISLMESQKYKASVATSTLGTGILTNGTFVPTSPVAWWALNEGTGSSTYDQSGGSNNGSWTGIATGVSGYYSPGYVNSWAGTFDGSTSYVSVPNALALNPSNAMTVTLWVNLSSWNIAWQTILSKRNNGGCFTGWTIARSNTLALVYLGICDLSGSNKSITINNNFPTNTWSFIAFTAGNSAIYTYFNGAFVASSTYSGGGISTSTTPLYIGNDTAAGGRQFNGLIQDVRIYNRALSPAEIQAMYNAKN